MRHIYLLGILCVLVAACGADVVAANRVHFKSIEGQAHTGQELMRRCTVGSAEPATCKAATQSFAQIERKAREVEGLPPLASPSPTKTP
jgi:hypothetical protein